MDILSRFNRVTLLTVKLIHVTEIISNLASAIWYNLMISIAKFKDFDTHGRNIHAVLYDIVTSRSNGTTRYVLESKGMRPLDLIKYFPSGCAHSQLGPVRGPK